MRSAAAALALGALFIPAPAPAAGGDLRWSYPAPAAGKQEAKAAVFDVEGNIIVAGFTGTDPTDFLTLKVRSDGSGPAWPAASFDLAGGNDVALAVAVDSQKHVIVAGYAWNGVNFDFQTIKYDGSTGAVLWQHTYDGVVHGNDLGTSVAVDSLDNVYVGGYTQGANGKDDFLLLKYGPDGPNPDGTPMWVVTYDGPPAGHDRILAVAAGPDGVAVTGESQNAAGNFDCLTLKYRFDGATAWSAERRYASAPGGDSRGVDVALDLAGNVVMAGYVFNGSNRDFYTAKYPAGDGSALWVRIVDNGHDDEGAALWIDALGDVFVTGTTFRLGSAKDILTLKYAGDTGGEAWSQPYNSANGDNDIGLSLVVDESGDVFVAGFDDSAVSGFDDVLLLKYRKDNGALLWDRVYDGAGHDDRALGVGLAPGGDVLVAGWSDRWTGGAFDYDFLALRFDPGALNPPTGLAAATVSNAEIALSWLDNAGNEDGFVVERKLCASGSYAPVTIDPLPADTRSYNDAHLQPDTRYCYRVKAVSATLGNSPYSNEADARTTVIGYDPPSWLFRLNGTDNGDDYPQAVAVGPDNHPVVTGHSFSLEGAFDYLTIKLDRASAAEKWRARYDDPDFESDFATAVAVDGENRAIVTGYASLYAAGGSGNSNDVYTLGYPADGLPRDAAGNALSLWDDQYNGPAGGDDRSSAVAVATDGSNNAVVIGYGRNVAWNDDIYVLKYAPDGTRIWAAVPFDGGGNDYPTAVAFGAAGDVFVGGYTDSGAGLDFFVARYRGSDGRMLWKDIRNGADNGDDYIEDLAVDAAGNLYVTGYSANAAGNGDFYTIKYDGAGNGIPDGNGVAGGRVLWQQTWDGGGTDRAVAVRIDPLDGEVIVAGTTYVAPGNHDVHLIRYTPDGDGSGQGVAVWERTLDRPGMDEAVAAMAIDRSGTVCVVGSSGDDMLAVKYDHTGAVVGATVYGGSAGGEDAALAVAVNAYGEAFVAGHSHNAAGNADYVVFKADGEVMQTPVPLTAAQLYTEVALSWTDNALNEAGFHLERKVGACADAGLWTALPDAAAGSTGYLDQGLNPGATYCYRVRSYNAAGEVSRWAEVEVDTAAPAPPAGLVARVLNTTEVELSWTDTTASESGFALERCQGAGCDFSVVDATLPVPARPGSSSPVLFVDRSACPGQTYSYRVHAFQSGAWVSAWSNVAADNTTPIPTAPTGLAAPGVFEVRVELTWRDANSDEESFAVERCTGPQVACAADGSFTEVGSAPASPGGLLLQYRLDEGGWNGTAGEVIDHSGQGNHGRSAGGATTAAGRYGRAGSFDGIDDTVVTPLLLDQSASSPGATLQAWVRPDPDSTGTRYVLGTDNGGYDWGVLLIGSAWYVSTGESQFYTGLTATLGQWQHIAAVFIPGTGIRFYRNGVEVAISQIGYDASTASVHVGRQGSAGSYFKGLIDEAAVFGRPLSAAEVQSLYLQGLTRFADQGVTHSTTYTYRVRARKTAACGWPTPPTGPVEVYTRPPAPAALTATPLDTSRIRLSWEDNTATETGFRVLRCTGSGCGDFAEVGTVGANVVEFVDETVCAGTTYAYRVSAVRAGEWESDPTSAATAATPAPSLPLGLALVGVSEERIELEWSYPNKDFSGFRVGRCQGDAAACAQDTDFQPLPEVSDRPPGALLHYRMDEVSWSGAAAVRDATGSGRHGTAYNGLATTDGGKYGRAGSFNSGSSQYIATPVNLDQSAASAGVTFEAWVYPTVSDYSYKHVFGTDNGGYDWGLLQYGSTWYVSTGNSYQNTGVTADLNQWQHIVAVFVPGTGIRFYKNGAAPVTISDIGYDTSDYNVAIGQKGNATYFFPGRIDEAIVYNRPLSDQEVRDRHSGKMRLVEAGLPSGTLFHYRVRAYKNAGCGWDGPYGAVSAATLTPPAPSGLTAGTVDSTRIDLAWTDNTTSETGFRLDHCPGTRLECLGDPSADPPVAPVKTFDDPPLLLGADIAAYSDTAVCAGTTHTYRVRAEPWPTAWAGPVQASTPLPQTPGGFVASGASESTVALSWEDTNIDESAYVVERCLGDAAACPAQTGAFTAVQTLAASLPGRLLHYRMDEAVWSGATGEVLDISGKNNHGRAYNGATTTASGRYGRAGSFDGSNDYVGSPLQVDQTSASAGATFEAWVYPTSSSSYRYVFGTDNGGYDWGLLQYGTTWYISTGTNRYSTSVAVDLNQWQHVAAVFIPGTGIRFYKNGAEVKTFTVSYLDYDASTANVAIGQSGGNTYYFAGRIDEAAVYGRPLAAADILAHYQERIDAYRHTDTGLLPGTTYTYRVSAQKSAACGWVSPYAVAAAATQTPPPPTDFSAVPLDTTRIELAWADTTTSETGFRLQRCQGAGCTGFADLGTLLPPGTTTFVDSTACSDSTYLYQLRAENGAVPWQTVWVGPVSATTAAPAAPGDLSAVRVSEVEIRLSWSDNTNDESGFLVERCSSAGCREFSVAAGITRYDDDELEVGVSYTYRVRAFKTAACGWVTGFSNVASASTDVVAPVLTASPINTTGIDLAWSDTATSETGFRLQRCAGDGCSDFADLDPQPSLPAGTTGFSDTTLCRGQSYSYRLEAYAQQSGLSNAGGGCWSRRAPLTFTSFVANAKASIDIPYDADMRPDFGDLRFYDAKAKRELPYWVREKSNGVSARVWLQTGENDNIYLVYGNPSASDAGSESPFTTGYDDFQGTTIDTGKWAVLNPRNAVAQGDGLLLRDVGGDAWDTLVVSKALFPRTGSPILRLHLSLPADTPENNYFMAGWYVDNTSYASISYFVHGLYWNNYSFYTRENNSSSASGKSYTASTDYEVKIEVKEAGGARYWVRGGAYADWTLLRETTYSSAPLRLAVLQNSHQATVRSVTVQQAGAALGAALGPEESAACFLFVNTWSSGYSNTATAITRTPVAPTALTATAVSDTVVNLSWLDGNNDESGIEIERCTVGTDCPAYAPLHTVAGGVTAYADATAQPSTSYSYRVRAFKAAGCGWVTGFGDAAVDATFPAKASGLQATPLNSRMIRLRWDDLASDEEGYEVEVQVWNGRFVTVGTVGPDVTSYTDTVGIEPGTAYRYRVRPFRGQDKAPYSDEATTTTPPWAAGHGTCPP